VLGIIWSNDISKVCSVKYNMDCLQQPCIIHQLLNKEISGVKIQAIYNFKWIMHFLIHEHYNDWSIVSLNGKFWTYKTGRTLPFSIKVCVLSRGREWSSINVFKESILFSIFLLDSGTLPTVCFFPFYYANERSVNQSTGHYKVIGYIFVQHWEIKLRQVI